jgi:hypothetical protein
MNFALFVAFAFTGGDDFPLLWFVLGAIRDDDPAACRASFFNTPDQNAVVQWGKFRSHVVDSFREYSVEI